ncbi:MAG TPA: GNAT family N-acetyltransferase [Desulfatiglandales bacterium]|nr:GNAT family N-acetyltransferase [Desulfatiglandales bacterium]
MGIEIGRLGKENLADIQSLLEGYKFKPFQGYPNLPAARINSYFLQHISHLVSHSQDNRMLIAEEDGAGVVGLAALERLPWDTRHFGVQMARIGHLISGGSYERELFIKNQLLSAIFDLCKEEEIAFISVKPNVGDLSSIHCLEENGFRLMSTYQNYLLDKEHYLPEGRVSEERLCTNRPFELKDLSSVLSLAKGSFRVTHFYADRRLPRSMCDDLYVEWARKSCEGFAKEVMMIEVDNRIAGFATFDIDEFFSQFMGTRMGRFVLCAISPSFRRKGIFRSHVRQAADYCLRKVDSIDIEIPVDNWRASHPWSQVGARVVSCRHVFHRWLDK